MEIISNYKRINECSVSFTTLSRRTWIPGISYLSNFDFLFKFDKIIIKFLNIIEINKLIKKKKLKKKYIKFKKKKIRNKNKNKIK